MVEGGIFTILHNALHELSNFIKNEEVEVIALVHDASKFQFSNITVIEIPLSKKSWWFRLYYEYFYFKKLSKQLQPDIWFSLHDTTPNVFVKKQFVYCHHPTTLFKPTWKDWKFDYKIGVFSVLYDFLFKINISKNHTIFVQQHWIKNIFEKGGEGTIAAYYKNFPGTMYAKTGTLGGQVALSGFIYTPKQQKLYFSVLVANHMSPSSAQVRRAVETYLTKVTKGM